MHVYNNILDIVITREKYNNLKLYDHCLRYLKLTIYAFIEENFSKGDRACLRQGEICVAAVLKCVS